MTKNQAQVIVYTHDIDSTMQLEGDELRENNPELYDAYVALLKLAEHTEDFKWSHE